MVASVSLSLSLPLSLLPPLPPSPPINRCVTVTSIQSFTLPNCTIGNIFESKVILLYNYLLSPRPLNLHKTLFDPQSITLTTDHSITPSSDCMRISLSFFIMQWCYFPWSTAFREFNKQGTHCPPLLLRVLCYCTRYHITYSSTNTACRYCSGIFCQAKFIYVSQLLLWIPGLKYVGLDVSRKLLSFMPPRDDVLYSYIIPHTTALSPIQAPTQLAAAGRWSYWK